MQKFLALTFILVIAAPLTALAQSEQDRADCMSDVMRLCQEAIPNAQRVVACLVRSKLQLSPACARVFNRARAASLKRL
jgi:hypothetical protein